MAPKDTLVALSGLLGGLFLAGVHTSWAWGLLAMFLFLFPGPRFVVVLTGAIAIGFLYYHAYFAIVASRTTLPANDTSFHAVVVKELPSGARSLRYALKLERPYRGTIEMVTTFENQYGYGDLLELQGRIEAGEGEREISAAIFPVVRKVGEGHGNPFRTTLLGLRERLLRPYQTYLPPLEAAFLGGITLGTREDLPEEFRSALRQSGTTHLVALSGYNIEIVVIAIAALFLSLLGRRIGFLATILGIPFFMGMVGFEPSLMRAALMASLFLIAKETGRMASVPHAMLWTATLMALYDPAILWNLGFQLSFLSLGGILFLAPRFQRVMPLRRAGTLSQTLGAQFAVAPLLLLRFGRLSPYALPANLLLTPLMPLTMFFGFSLALLGSIAPPLGYIPALIVETLLHYEVGIIQFFGEL